MLMMPLFIAAMLSLRLALATPPAAADAPFIAAMSDAIAFISCRC